MAPSRNLGLHRCHWGRRRTRRVRRHPVTSFITDPSGSVKRSWPQGDGESCPRRWCCVGRQCILHCQVLVHDLLYRFGVLTEETDLDALTRFGRALADPLRARLLLALCAGPGYPATLADALGVSRARLSNHLACLRDCGLVVAAPEGRQVRYELADSRMRDAIGDLRSVVLAVSTDRTCPDSASRGCC